MEKMFNKRFDRYLRNATRKQEAKGTQDRKCINQTIEEVGTWPSGQPMQRLCYYHVTRGYKTRLLSPLHLRFGLRGRY